MLVNVYLKQYQDEHTAMLREKFKDDLNFIAHIDLRIARNSVLPETTGIYEGYGLNFSYEIIDRLSFKHEWPLLGKITEFKFSNDEEPKFFGELGSYGVADTIEQVLERYKSDLENPDRKFCISTFIITKADQPEEGGWRWHKWGEYIGTFEPEQEYLYDEKGIEQVLIYQIYEIPDHLVYGSREKAITV